MKTIALTPFAPFLLAIACHGATAADALTPPPPVQKVSVRAVAHFGFDQASLRSQDQERLLAEVSQMKDVTWQTVTAVGHTDSVGPAPYNEALAARRAAAVKAFLVGKGLEASMIRADGRGESAPAADNDSGPGRAQNRRTEIEFQGVRAGG